MAYPVYISETGFNPANEGGEDMEEFERMQAKLKLLGELSKGESSAKENGYIDESEVEKLLGVNNG